MLSHITENTAFTNETVSSVNVPNAQMRDPLSSKSSMVPIRGGFPPVPLKLMNKIELGEFVDMGELLLN